MAETYAIVESGGKQYRAEQGETLLVDRLPADEGAKVALRPLMFRGDDVVVGASDLEKVKVEAVVAEHLRGPKVKVFKYRPKKGYRRRAGHRSELTKLEVTEVKMLTRRPAGASKQKAESSKQGTASTTRKAPSEKKPAARKPAARKPAAKKPTQRKPAARKPAQKKEEK